MALIYNSNKTIYIKFLSLPFLIHLIKTQTKSTVMWTISSRGFVQLFGLHFGTYLQCTVQEGKACPAGVELYVIRLEMNCCLPCLQGLHYSRHQLSKDAQNGRGKVVVVVKTYPGSCKSITQNIAIVNLQRIIFHSIYQIFPF